MHAQQESQMAVCRGFSSAQKQPKQNASSQNCEENGSTTLRNTREKPLLAGYMGFDFYEISSFTLSKFFYHRIVCKIMNLFDILNMLNGHTRVEQMEMCDKKQCNAWNCMFYAFHYRKEQLFN